MTNIPTVFREDFYNLAKVALVLAEADNSFRLRLAANRGEVKPEDLAEVRAVMAALFKNLARTLGIEHMAYGVTDVAKLDATRELATTLIAAVRERNETLNEVSIPTAHSDRSF